MTFEFSGFWASCLCGSPSRESLVKHAWQQEAWINLNPSSAGDAITAVQFLVCWKLFLDKFNPIQWPRWVIISCLHNSPDPVLWLSYVSLKLIKTLHHLKFVNFHLIHTIFSNCKLVAVTNCVHKAIINLFLLYGFFSLDSYLCINWVIFGYAFPVL